MTSTEQHRGSCSACGASWAACQARSLLGACCGTCLEHYRSTHPTEGERA